MNKTTIVLIYAVIIIALIVLGPYALIWSLNTLFPILAIPYTLDTWMAAVVIGAVIGPRVRVNR